MARLATGAAMLVLSCASAPAGAQPSAPARVQIIAPECEGARGDEIVVCGQRDDRRSPFRLPEEPDRGFDPSGAFDSVSRERNALTEPGARTGIGSCSTVGPAGAMGCMTRDFSRDIEQYGGDPPSARNGYRRRRN